MAKKVEFQVPEDRFVAHAVCVVVSFDGEGRRFLNTAAVGDPDTWTRAALYRAGANREESRIARMWEGE